VSLPKLRLCEVPQEVRGAHNDLDSALRRPSGQLRKLPRDVAASRHSHACVACGSVQSAHRYFPNLTHMPPVHISRPEVTREPLTWKRARKIR
jgi:hypothetical protein